MTDSTSMRTDHCGTLRATDIGREVAVCGWVARRREHGEHLAFIDLRDHTGLVQCVVDGAADLRSEYVLRITGTVRRRPDGTTNANLPTGEIEIGDCAVEVLNAAEPPPFQLDDRVEVDEMVASPTAMWISVPTGCNETYASEPRSMVRCDEQWIHRVSSRSRHRC